MIVTWLKSLKARERAWRHRLGQDISTPKARREAVFHFNWLDHGILRKLWTNGAEIAPGVYRSNQPSPERLERLKSQGIVTILNLRGPAHTSPYLLEKEACGKLGLNLVDYRMYAASLATREEILGLVDLFRDIEKPVLMHCKSGSDRTGFAAVLYRHLIVGEPIETAMKELSWRFIHFRNSKFGILDVFFETYLEARKANGIDLMTWIKTEYDRDAITESFARKT